MTVILPSKSETQAPSPEAGKCLLVFQTQAGPMAFNPAHIAAISASPTLGHSMVLAGGVAVETPIPTQLALQAWSAAMGYKLAMINPSPAPRLAQ